MGTEHIRLAQEGSYEKCLDRAADVLAGGGIVAFPTETVYGVGVNAADAGAVARLRELKQRSADKPFTVRRGGTVLDVAGLVHKEIARDLKFARMWGAEVFDGQQVGPDHLVVDGDLLELHL